MKKTVKSVKKAETRVNVEDLPLKSEGKVKGGLSLNFRKIE
jgi:hypothetical protein